MSTVIVPVGLSMGQDFADGGSAGHPPYWQVHFGTLATDITPDEAHVWAAAFAAPAQPSGNDATRDRLEALLRETEVTDPAPVISRLLERGLLVEFDPLGPELERTFTNLQLFPLGVGLGNSQDEPFRYQIGLGAQPVLGVTANVYAVWSYAMTCPSLWAACAELAAGIDKHVQSDEEPLGLSPSDVAAEVGTALPLLVATGCSFLDAINYGR